MPTPVKYYSDEVRNAYKSVEEYACDSLLSMLPEDLREDFVPLFVKQEGDLELWKLVKAADKISALIKCIEERRSGSGEFDKAAESTRNALLEMGVPEAKVFIDEILPAYDLTLDELKS